MTKQYPKHENTPNIAPSDVPPPSLSLSPITSLYPRTLPGARYSPGHQVSICTQRGGGVGGSSYHALQLAGLQPAALPQVGLPHDVQLADHRHALDDARLLSVLGLGLQAVQVLPRVHGLQVRHLAERGLSAQREGMKYSINIQSMKAHCVLWASSYLINIFNIYLIDGLHRIYLIYLKSNKYIKYDGDFLIIFAVPIKKRIEWYGTQLKEVQSSTAVVFRSLHITETKTVKQK